MAKALLKTGRLKMQMVATLHHHLMALHTWHHSPEQLLYTINKDGNEMGGQMSAFEKRLSKEEKQALIDYMYNLWPKEIQTRYDQKFN